MSELEPTPEKKVIPLKDNCNSCGKDYRIKKDNAVLFTYEKQAECNFVFCQCPHCQTKTRIYCSQDYAEAARGNGIHEEANDYATDAVYEQWLDMKGIILPESYELTPRHEELVKHFGEVMTAAFDDAPDFAWDEMNSPQGRRTLPLRWC